MCLKESEVQTQSLQPSAQAIPHAMADWISQGLKEKPKSQDCLDILLSQWAPLLLHSATNTSGFFLLIFLLLCCTREYCRSLGQHLMKSYHVSGMGWSWEKQKMRNRFSFPRGAHNPAGKQNQNRLFQASIISVRTEISTGHHWTTGEGPFYRMETST